ncbi:MAG TPA: hypothetical protein VFS43_20740 [Polyangiaceae bacterium]|nr:hypothetical protein [Polyangiaceae bacterium]
MAAALALAPLQAPAAPIGPTTEALPVIPLEAGIEEDWAAKLVTGALREAVLRSDEYTVMDGVLPFSSLRIQAKCAVIDPRHGVTEVGDFSVDEACLKRIGRRLGVKRFLWGHVYSYAKEGAAPMVKVHLWREGEPDRSLYLPFHPQAVERMAERFYRHLVIPEKTAEVELTTERPVDGDLFIDGQQRGPYEPRLRLSLFPGEHAIEVRRDGKVVVAAKALVSLAPGRIQGVTLAPAEPVTGPVVPPPRLPPTGEAVPPVESSARTTWAWVALGAGTASIGAGLLLNARMNALDDRWSSDPALAAYRRGAPPGQDVCDAAEAGIESPWPGAATRARVDRLCSGGDTLGVLRSVFYGVGALGIGAGVALLVTSKTSSARRAANAPTSWQLVPLAGPSFGGLQAATSF